MVIPFYRALIDPTGKYRYFLSRKWAQDRGRACFIMLNPSTADAEKDDSTIRRCIWFAKSLGCGSLYVVNLFAFRATNPRELLRTSDPVGPENDKHIKWAVGRSNYIIAAWGVEKPNYTRRAAVVRGLLAKEGKQIHCFGMTKNGCPRHPLMLRNETKLQRYEIEGY